MLEAEDSALPLRVYDLEKLVREQQDEITFLKSTVADLQRRLNLVDGCRGEYATLVDGLMEVNNGYSYYQ